MIIGNRVNGDGCNSNWEIESMHACDGGDTENPDTWERWINGSSPINNDSECGAKWGDGMKHDDEEWDDALSEDYDGWRNWHILSGWVCYGGTYTRTDTWSKWSNGLSPNEQKSSCTVNWGDGLKHSSEQW